MSEHTAESDAHGVVFQDGSKVIVCSCGETFRDQYYSAVGVTLRAPEEFASHIRATRVTPPGRTEATS